VRPAMMNPTAHDLLTSAGFSHPVRFDSVVWNTVPAEPGVYVIFDCEECLYVGMAGRDGSGSLRSRLRDHSSGQVVNMFAQYLFLARGSLNRNLVLHTRGPQRRRAVRTYWSVVRFGILLLALRQRPASSRASSRESLHPC